MIHKTYQQTYSKANIGFEALFLYLGALCLCLYLMYYDENCKIRCAGPTVFGLFNT